MAKEKYNINKARVDPEVMSRIEELLLSLNGWGSVEVQVQDFQIVQMTKKQVFKP